MIPLRDNNATASKPYVVYGLIALNVGVFIVQMFGLLDKFTMVPYSVIHDVRVSLATLNGRPIANQFGNPVFATMPLIGPHPQWITIFTSMFMHGGLMHIGGNMLYLWIFGNNIEDALGHVKFLFFYLLCGVLAAGAHVLMSGALATGTPIPDVGNAITLKTLGAGIPTLGASGAIAGVLGAYLVLYPRARIDTLLVLGWFWDMIQIPAFYVLGVWFVLQLTGTFGTGGQVGGGVAYWAHIGGFVAGMLLIVILGGRKLTRPRRSRQSSWNEGRPYPFRPWK